MRTSKATDELEGADESICTRKNIVLGNVPCFRCCCHVDVIDMSNALEYYLPAEMADPIADHRYCKFDEDPSFGNDVVHGGMTFARYFVYDGTAESLRCRTGKFGAGPKDSSDSTACTGRYGGATTFWRHRVTDGVVEWYEMDWEPEARVAPVRLEDMTEEQLAAHIAANCSDSSSEGAAGGDDPAYTGDHSSSS